MELKDIIHEYKRRHQLSNDQMAKLFNVSHTTVGRWLKGDVKTLQDETAARISQIIGYDVQAMLQGTAITMKRPILGLARAGYDLFLDENYLGEEGVTKEEYEDGDYFLKITGDSMIHAGILDGSLVYVKKCSLVSSGEIAVVAVGNEVTVKYVDIKKDGLTLKAANPSYEDKFFSFNDVEQLPVRIIGRVLFCKNYY